MADDIPVELGYVQYIELDLIKFSIAELWQQSPEPPPQAFAWFQISDLLFVLVQDQQSRSFLHNTYIYTLDLQNIWTPWTHCAPTAVSCCPPWSMAAGNHQDSGGCMVDQIDSFYCLFNCPQPLCNSRMYCSGLKIFFIWRILNLNKLYDLFWRCAPIPPYICLMIAPLSFSSKVMTRVVGRQEQIVELEIWLGLVAWQKQKLKWRCLNSWEGFSLTMEEWDPLNVIKLNELNPQLSARICPAILANLVVKLRIRESLILSLWLLSLNKGLILWKATHHDGYDAIICIIHDCGDWLPCVCRSFIRHLWATVTCHHSVNWAVTLSSERVFPASTDDQKTQKRHKKYLKRTRQYWSAWLV